MDLSPVVEFLLQLENKQQLKANNVETQHKCMYIVFPTYSHALPA